ncbi:MAG: ABC transporter ATP-binding protein [Lachnospiraceae bacterium]|nr:ABC transporter ATP-binding protein [Lachnospiraceae bacterium]
MEKSLLVVKNLSAWYQREQEVLSAFSLELAEHEAVGLIGLNGAGKTTFLKVLSGLLPTFQSNGIVFRGKSVKMRDRNFKVNRYTVFAEDNSFQYFTFREYLAYVFAAYGKELPKQSELSALIRGFHFDAFTDVLLKDLSTGNRRKVFLITAFALKPALLLLDEPVNGLDFQSTEFLYEQIARYKEHGTLLFSSHILESITLTSDRVVVLEDGRIRQTFEGGQMDAAELREALHNETNDV